jgi:hypothetical protein
MIDATTVRELTGSVLSPDGTIVEGIVRNFGIDVPKLEKDRDLVRSWIAELPTEFLQEGGGGWSFLQLCATRDGELWGEQSTAESLYVLAAALGLAKFLMPRDMWKLFPGGMPYMVFTLKGF